MTDIPETLTLPEGQAHEIELPGLGTAGYRWNHTIQGEPGVVDVTWRRGTPAAQARPAPVGVSSPEWVTIRATRPGQVSLQLFQHRPWESATEPRSRHTIVVQVVPAER